MIPSPDTRLAVAAEWLSQFPDLDPLSLRPASSDASFRRYFRVTSRDHGSRILMDAPPDREPLNAFLQVAGLFDRAGLRVPARLGASAALGLLLLEDFGDQPYLPLLNRQTARPLYESAWRCLVKLQRWGQDQSPDELALPQYDRNSLLAEMSLFRTWYVERHLGVQLTAQEASGLDEAIDQLCERAIRQHQVVVHRDFHSRNLMVLPETLKANGQPGILDFQDAVVGPLSYDLVCLLRDAYIVWDETEQIDWAIRYWEAARQAGVRVPADFGVFWEDFEWMGIQRQLKVLGIFARLAHRDAKHEYLKDIPAVLAYASGAAHRYGRLSGLARLLDRLGQVTTETRLTF